MEAEPSDQFEWMQIWPVYAAPDPLTSGAIPKTLDLIVWSGANDSGEPIGSEKLPMENLGGGKFSAHEQPARQLGRLEIMERGEIRARRVTALVANLPQHIGERECRLIAEKTGWPAVTCCPT